MTQDRQKTLLILGAGRGLGAALARRFGPEGYRIALVARRPAVLEERVTELKAEGLDATAFPADLTELSRLPALVQNIERVLGGIDVAVFMPISPGPLFVPALELDAAKLRPLMELFAFAPIEVAHALLPSLTARGGAFVYANGMSSILTMPGYSGVGPAMAAARNFVLTLNAEGKSQGVYAGAVTIGAFIEGSESHTAATSGGKEFHFPTIRPSSIADEVWSLVARRDRVEAVLPPLK